MRYVRGNRWPSVRFTDDADLNRQTLQWCDIVTNRRIHGTTHRVAPGDAGRGADLTWGSCRNELCWRPTLGSTVR